MISFSNSNLAASQLLRSWIAEKIVVLLERQLIESHLKWSFFVHAIANERHGELLWPAPNLARRNMNELIRIAINVPFVEDIVPSLMDVREKPFDPPTMRLLYWIFFQTNGQLSEITDASDLHELYKKLPAIELDDRPEHVFEIRFDFFPNPFRPAKVDTDFAFFLCPIEEYHQILNCGFSERRAAGITLQKDWKLCVSEARDYVEHFDWRNLKKFLIVCEFDPEHAQLNEESGEVVMQSREHAWPRYLFAYKVESLSEDEFAEQERPKPVEIRVKPRRTFAGMAQDFLMFSMFLVTIYVLYNINYSKILQALWNMICGLFWIY